MNRTRAAARLPISLRWVPVWGPGLLVMLADTDAGNVVTAAQAGAQWGWRLLPLLLVLIVPLYLVQELTVRLGIFTKRGHGELIREHFGPIWAWTSVVSLAIATAGSLVTEFTAVAGIGEMFGLPRAPVLSAAAIALMGVVATGSYRRVERTMLAIAMFELAFFVVAWRTHPEWHTLAHAATDWPLGDRAFLWLAAALVGAVFNPWMVFYQQAAVVDKRLRAEDQLVARIDTGLGAVLTQLLTASVLIAAAATFAGGGSGAHANASMQSIGEIAEALTPLVGAQAGRIVFAVGVLGAAMVAAVVASLALAWGVGELAGYRHTLESRPQQAPWFYGIYALAVVASALLVGTVQNLVWLNIGAQIVNALLLPLVIGLLIALAARALPPDQRLAGVGKWAVITVTAAVCAVGWIGAIWGWGS